MANMLASLRKFPGFSWPVGLPDARISSAYGCREGGRSDPRCPEGKRVHNGIDVISDNREAPILAVYGGVVTVASTNNPESSYKPGFSNYGRVVVIKHPGPPEWFTLYAHLSRVDVIAGQTVEAGQQIGLMGRTAGNKENPNAVFGESRAHLHFEMSPTKYPQSLYNVRANPVHMMHWGPDFFEYFPPKVLTCLFGLRAK